MVSATTVNCKLANGVRMLPPRGLASRRSTLTKTTSVFFALALCASLASKSRDAAAQDAAKPAIDGVKVTHFDRFVPTGIEQKVGFVMPINPDCSPLEIPTPRLVIKPEHGEVRFVTSEDFGTWPPPNSRDKCSDKKYPSLRVNYKSADNYLGKDEIGVLFIFSDSTAIQYNFTIDVR